MPADDPMKRLYYVSRFARRLSSRDLAHIQSSSLQNNPGRRITGFLVCLGDTFFQLLEGPAAEVDRLYHDKILPDDRHRDILCLKVEDKIRKRMFPEWQMKVFNLNEQTEALPLAFREMLTALLESHLTTTRFTQPSILRMLEHGIDPATVAPRRKNVTVLFSDILGFSRFAEQVPARDLIDLVNSHVEVCARWVSHGGGEINKLTGDGVLAYFPGRTSDAAIESALGIIREMAQRRSRAPGNSPHRSLYGGVGLAAGLVYEGIIGVDLKRDFTILGNKVNLAAWLESMTRDLNVRFAADRTVMRRAEQEWGFVSLGKHETKGRSKPVEVFTLGSLPGLDVGAIRREIEEYTRAVRR